MPEHEDVNGSALDDLWALMAQIVPRGGTAGADTTECDRWRQEADRERTLWDLGEGLLDEEPEREEWAHVRGCRQCLTALQQILAGIEKADAQPRWNREQIQALIAASAAPAPSPTEQALGAARDLVVRLAERGLEYVTGTARLVPVTARTRKARKSAEAGTVVAVQWDRDWGSLEAEVDRTEGLCTVEFDAHAKPGVGGAKPIRLDWRDEQDNLLHSQDLDDRGAVVSEVAPGLYVIVIVADDEEIDRLTVQLQ